MNLIKYICLLVILSVLITVFAVKCVQLRSDSTLLGDDSTSHTDDTADTDPSLDGVTDTTTAIGEVTDITPSTDETTDTTLSTDEVTNVDPPVEEPVIEWTNPAYRLDGLPEFVEHMASFANKKKQYVLPDGYLYTYSNSKWSCTEPYVSADWYEEIAATVDTVRGLELPDGSKVTKFMLSSDMHVTPGSLNCFTENLGKICAEVMRACGVPFYVDAGDNCTQSAEFRPSYFKNNIACVLSHLEPIPRKNLLFGLGNHDGATGMREYNGEMVYYRFQLNNQQRSEVFFDWQRQSNPDKVFDDDGTYYYIDDPTTQTRYIVLNPFWSKWAGDSDGFVSDIEHSFFHRSLFGSKQLNWFAYEALDMPSGYAAVIVAHNVNVAKDFEIFRGIVNAYSNRCAYSGTHIGEKSWQFTQIHVDYSNVEGEIIAVFQGHEHKNMQHDYFDRVPCINITTTAANWDVRDENAVPRVKGTATEFAVDTVIIDRVSRTIYMIRLGVGDDRVIHY